MALNFELGGREGAAEAVLLSSGLGGTAGFWQLQLAALGEDELATLSDYLRGSDVRIHVSLGTGDAASTVWGCDLTAGYVRINADYTT